DGVPTARPAQGGSCLFDFRHPLRAFGIIVEGDSAFLCAERPGRSAPDLIQGLHVRSALRLDGIAHADHVRCDAAGLEVSDSFGAYVSPASVAGAVRGRQSAGGLRAKNAITETKGSGAFVLDLNYEIAGVWAAR